MTGETDRKPKVLVVDDSRFVRRMIRRLLEDEGEFEVAGEAANGAEALQALRDCQPDVITLDLDMPVMGGAEFLSRLREESATPVVVVSALPVALAASVLESDALEVEGLVEKSVSPAALDLSVFAQELRAALFKALA